VARRLVAVTAPSDPTGPVDPTQDAAGPGAGPAELPLWHVTLTVSGDPVDTGGLEAALHRLAEERPFLLSARYAADRAEVRYWDEAADVADAAAIALRLWTDHRVTAGLPRWRVVGLEVVDRATVRAREGSPAARTLAAGLGDVRPL
jgi:hypothetical protein